MLEPELSVDPVSVELDDVDVSLELRLLFFFFFVVVSDVLVSLIPVCDALPVPVAVPVPAVPDVSVDVPEVSVDEPDVSVEEPDDVSEPVPLDEVLEPDVLVSPVPLVVPDVRLPPVSPRVPLELVAVFPVPALPPPPPPCA